VNRGELLTRFQEIYPIYRNKVQTKTFMRWITTWCDFKEYSLDKNYRRSGNDFYIYIKNK
jgi:hypothetical protein